MSLSCFWIVTELLVSVTSALVAAPEPNDTALMVRGAWVQRQQTPNGELTIIKEHTDRHTHLTVYNADNKVIYAHTSEYKIERLGKVNVFTFFNKKITAGKGVGDTIAGPTSYVFRVTKARFIEVRGVVDGDPSAPAMVTWERYRPTTEPPGVQTFLRERPA